MFVIPEGAFFEAGSAWLGWNAATGQHLPHPVVPGLPDAVEELTAAPQKYGFHGTIKPPFSLAEGTNLAALRSAMQAFCDLHGPVVIPCLEVRRIGRFVAITPCDPNHSLSALASSAVAAFDAFRAPTSEAELARRRRAKLSHRQEEMLVRWGYPYVFEEFRFHITLTGRTPNADATKEALSAYFAPGMPHPFIIRSLCLMGEDAVGRFHLIHRYDLSG